MRLFRRTTAETEHYESSNYHIELAHQRSAHNYHPLPVVLSHGEGAWVTDVDGRRYLDLLAAYSAVNFGHRHPTLTAAAHRQLDRMTLTSRAFHSDQFAPFCAELANLCGKDAVLPMNTGVEAVETALKVVRKWGYAAKGVPDGRAEVIVCAGGFHGRTITVISFSTDDIARSGFGPFTPGFRSVAYGDAEAVADAVTPFTVAVLVEPVQGEAGVIIPPEGYLRRLREICDHNNILMVADEIQSGLCRTGTTFACDQEGVVPDVYVLGKALGGGIVPLSAVVANWNVLDVLGPGQHGSTFGGNPLACAVGREVIGLVSSGEYQRRSRELGAQLRRRLDEMNPSKVAATRSRGLWGAVDLAPGQPAAREVCRRLQERGVLAKDTQARTIRLAPPLVITSDELDLALDRLQEVLNQ